jgi:hypothetical protein
MYSHIDAYNQGSSSFEPPLELLKILLTNSFAGSSEATCEGYTMSKRVDKKDTKQSKIFKSEPAVDFPPPISLVKE